jgi:peptidoglycan/xylan/chitin deacetylase (PgdA/CDA1 family)
MAYNRRHNKYANRVNPFLFIVLVCAVIGLAVFSAVIYNENRSLRAEAAALQELAEPHGQQGEGLEGAAAPAEADGAPLVAGEEPSGGEADAAQGGTAGAVGKPGRRPDKPKPEEVSYGRDTDEREPVKPYEGVAGSAPYQALYPELYADRPDEWVIQEKTMFLTFDDGPTVYTGQVLDTLRDKQVKGTFFVVGTSVANLGDRGKDLLRRIVDEGHTLAIHCNVHKYEDIYQSVEAFLDDFNKAYEMIFEITGTRADIFRFPGGSVNNFNADVRDRLFDEMTRRGFTYYDWNAASGDSSKKVTVESAYQNSVSQAGSGRRVILLMHDTREASVNALPRVIDKYLENGYNFSRITNRDKPICL